MSKKNWYYKDKTEKCCPRCKKTLPLTEGFGNKRRGQPCGSNYCKRCQSEEAVERARKTKREAVDYLGGVCLVCGYNRCLGALEFHHKESSEKDFTIGGKKLSSIKKIKPELDKCGLLCANCHREVHAGLIKLPKR